MGQQHQQTIDAEDLRSSCVLTNDDVLDVLLVRRHIEFAKQFPTHLVQQMLHLFEE